MLSLNRETGRKIENGEMMTISSDDLEAETTFYNAQYKKCCKCGYDANTDFEYCPKCGTKL